MSEDALNSSDAGRDYLTRYQRAIAGKTQQQFELETSEWQSQMDAWNAAVETVRQTNPNATSSELSEQCGTCPWPPPLTPTSQWRPCGPFHAMLERIMPYSLAGFLWYQGEEDEQYSGSYRELLGMMIGEWRALWSENLPFLIVQLPQWINGKTAADGNDPMRWPVLREAQWDAAQSIDNVYAICTIDCGEYDNIHPLDKRTPGERLANCALRPSTAWIAFRCTARRCWASDATRTAAYACSSAMRTVCISKAPRPAAATMISMASCRLWCACRNVPASNWPVPTVCSTRRPPRFSWIATSMISSIPE